MKNGDDMKWIAGYVAAVCILLIMIAQSIFIPTFFTPFISRHYERRDIHGSINMEKEELMYVTGELLDYMRGRREDLVVHAIVDGVEREFFSEIEIRHMVDVLYLYDAGFLIRNISFWMLLLMILGMAFFKMPILPVLARCCREVVVGFLILASILAGVIIWDFDRAFVVFHLLFFDNDYWILDPGVDLLINMVPQIFFVEISIFIGILMLIFSAIIILTSTLYLRSQGSSAKIVTRFR
ncbi:MAG: TIGR01906 family membrane protein [Defluviitaleaceae bacterium]|nr:TIGR01906 family membrane protein [Defluviitaleaceae bacterium]